jgi:shikimate kinase
MKRHIVLVGLPGSGKSTVGRIAADLLQTQVSDTDEIVSSAMGRSVAEIFAVSGEVEFRRLERAAMEGALADDPHVIAPGAGWVAQPGNFASAAGALLIYLRVPPEVACVRVESGEARPLLGSGDPTARLKALLQAREPWYRRAEREIDASTASALEVAQAVAALAQRAGGW